MRQELESSRMQFIGRAEKGGYHWSVVEVRGEHLTKKQAEAELRTVAIPLHACEGSELTFIYSNNRGVSRLYAVLQNGTWVVDKVECVKT